MLPRPRTVAERVGFVLVALVVVANGLYQGVQLEAVSFDVFGVFVRIVAIDAIPATIAFSAAVLLSGALLAREVHEEPEPDERRRGGPRVTAIVPAYEDAEVLDESVTTLLASNYEDLDVCVVVEPGDEATRARAGELAEHEAVHVLEDRRPGSKAGAINDALARLDADHFVLLDADERVDPDFVPVGMHAIVDEGHDAFQARRVPRVTGAVEALAYGERLLFHAGHKLVEPLGFTYCRSSSLVVTREALATVDGLDDLLTEDIDLAHKAFRADLDVAKSRAVTNEMEAPHSLGDLWGQRRRWRTGHIEVLSKALRGGYDRGGWRGIVSTWRMVTSLAAGLFLLGLAAKVLLLLAFDLELLFLVPFVAIALALGPVVARDLREGHIRQASPALACIPLIYAGFGLLTIRSAFAYVLSWDGEWYQVDKTGS
jgi:cellulose synthase/poly-beta-1,6-N-acetylglucosamine synthase-like glycosyltransferase